MIAKHQEVVIDLFIAQLEGCAAKIQTQLSDTATVVEQGTFALAIETDLP
ncbi:MAG: hypothetical protein AAF462_08570 [Thermodesulfobacteriota bacterium]